MVRERSIVFMAVMVILSLLSMVQAQDRRDDGPGSPPSPPVNVAPSLAMMRRQAEELRARAREAQELSDRLRHQADELDQMVKQQMDRGGGPQDVERVKGELAEIKEAIGHAEQERRWQEADELRRRVERLMGRFRPMQSPALAWMSSKRSKERSNVCATKPGWRRSKAALTIPNVSRGRRTAWSNSCVSKGRVETTSPAGRCPPEVQDILKAAAQAEREGRMDDARRQREKAEIVARQLQERERQGSEQPGGQFKDEIVRGVEELKKEIGRLWQAVNEMRNRPKEDKPM